MWGPDVKGSVLTRLVPQGDCMVLGRGTAWCWEEGLHGVGQSHCMVLGRAEPLSFLPC